MRLEEEITKILANAKASLAIEGFEVTERETAIVQKFLKGEISEEEAIEKIKSGL